MAQHTPGPWRWRFKSGSLHQAGDTRYPYRETVLAPIYEADTGVDTDVSEANAWLIAAAPDLLAAAEHALEDFQQRALIGEAIDAASIEIMRELTVAIAKARGEGAP